ncbi:MAG: hypothetical protein KGQ57_00010 [Burkholderiales bacterium]|nr:hypothetical protein [Burkholderiales bacterium]
MVEFTFGCSRRTFDELDADGDASDDQEYEWSLVRAKPVRYLKWLSETEFSQTDARHDKNGRTLPNSPRIGFFPYPHRLATLDSLREKQHADLSITMLIEVLPGRYFFENGRHRAYWFATNNAEFVPLMVPRHQADRLRAMFE